MAEAFSGHEFLGAEFLLWLWYCTETEGGTFDLEEPKGRVGVAFDQLLELRSPEGGGRVTVRGDTPTRLPEAAAALRTGRLPVVARLLIAKDQTTFELTLDGLSFDLRSVKVTTEDPAVLQEGDPEKARLLFELPAIVDALFKTYLSLRASRNFQAQLLQQMREWVARRRGSSRITRTAGAA
jgi:hypothetical protein